MKKFSKLLSFILILSFIFIIAGCSNDTTNQGSTTEQTPQTSSTESTSSESDTTDTRKGGKNNPYTFDELYAYIQL